MVIYIQCRLALCLAVPDLLHQSETRTERHSSHEVFVCSGMSWWSFSRIELQFSWAYRQCALALLRFRRAHKDNAAYHGLATRQEKAEFRMRWMEQWAESKKQKMETESRLEEDNIEKDWLTQPALAKHFGSRKTAENYVRSCEQKGDGWRQYNQMAAAWEYKLLRVKGKSSSSRRWDISSQWEQETSCKTLHHCILLVLCVSCHVRAPIPVCMLLCAGRHFPLPVQHRAI